MENANYKVNIKDIYVGDVKGIKKTSDIYRSRLLCFEKTDEPFYKIFHNRPHMCPPGKDLLLIDLFKYEFKRSMLFVLDENKHANDLLFNSPHYPVLNISKDEDCLNSKICLSNNTYMMYELLKYYNYPEMVGYDDVLRMRYQFFANDFVLNNCELFSKKETPPEETTLATVDTHGKYRTFNDDCDGVFPVGYFYMMWYLSDNKYHPDYFKPEKREGKVLKLK